MTPTTLDFELCTSLGYYSFDGLFGDACYIPKTDFFNECCVQVPPRPMNAYFFNVLILFEFGRLCKVALLLSVCSMDWLKSWNGWWIIIYNNSQFLCLVSKLASAALICHVWGERNSRIFRAHGCTAQQLEIKVKTDINRACVSSWRRVRRQL